MRKNISYQLYIAIKSKATIIILVLLIIFTFTVHLVNHLQNIGTISVEALSSGADMYNQTSILGIILKFYYSDKIMLFVGIFVAMFTLIEIHGGYLKNIYTPFDFNKKFIFSKQIVILLYIFICFISVLITTFILSLVFLEHKGIGNFLQFIILTLLQVYMTFSFSSVIILYCIYVKSLLWGLIGTIMYMMFSPVTVYKIIDLIALYIFKDTNFTIVRYTPYGNIFRLSANDGYSEFLVAFIISTLFLIVSTYGSYKILKTKDTF